MKKKPIRKTGTRTKTAKKTRKPARKNSKDPVKDLPPNLSKALKNWAEGGTINEADVLKIAEIDYKNILLKIPFEKRFGALFRIKLAITYKKTNYYMLNKIAQFDPHKVAELALRLYQINGSGTITEEENDIRKYAQQAVKWIQICHQTTTSANYNEEENRRINLSILLFTGYKWGFSPSDVLPYLELTILKPHTKRFEMTINGERLFKVSDAARALRACFWHTQQSFRIPSSKADALRGKQNFRSKLCKTEEEEKELDALNRQSMQTLVNSNFKACEEGISREALFYDILKFVDVRWNEISSKEKHFKYLPSFNSAKK